MYEIVVTVTSVLIFVIPFLGFRYYETIWTSLQDSILRRENISIYGRGSWYIRNITTRARAIGYHVVESSISICVFLLFWYLVVVEYFSYILLTTGWFVLMAISGGYHKGVMVYNKNKEVLERLQRFYKRSVG